MSRRNRTASRAGSTVDPGASTQFTGTSTMSSFHCRAMNSSSRSKLKPSIVWASASAWATSRRNSLKPHWVSLTPVGSRIDTVSRRPLLSSERSPDFSAADAPSAAREPTIDVRSVVEQRQHPVEFVDRRRHVGVREQHGTATGGPQAVADGSPLALVVARTDNSQVHQTESVEQLAHPVAGTVVGDDQLPAQITVAQVGRDRCNRRNDSASFVERRDHHRQVRIGSDVLSAPALECLIRHAPDGTKAR